MDNVACVTKKPSRNWALDWIYGIVRCHPIREMNYVLVTPDTLVKYLKGFFRIVTQGENNVTCALD